MLGNDGNVSITNPLIEDKAPVVQGINNRVERILFILGCNNISRGTGLACAVWIFAMYDILGIDFCLDVGADNIMLELLGLRYTIIIEFEKEFDDRTQFSLS